MKYSNEDNGALITYRSLKDKEMLKQYFIECYYKKSIDLAKLADLCKNTFKIVKTSYNYTGDVEFDIFVARVQIYKLCNNIFNKK